MDSTAKKLKEYRKIIRRGVLYITLLILFFIFDKPLLDWFFGGESLLEAFTHYDYSGKEWLIWGMYFLCLFYIVLNHWINGFAKNRILSDVVIVVAGIYYVAVRCKTFSIGDHEIYIGSFSCPPWAKYMDVIFIPCIYSIVNGVCSVIKKKSLSSDSYWKNDKPLDENEPDKYFRTKLVSEVAKQINTFSDKTNSFTVGIVGPWGSGKTTFLNRLQKEVETGPNLVLQFNPWQYPPEISLSEAFLKEVNEKMEKYTFRDSSISDYLHKLLGNNNSFLKVAINGFFPVQSIDQLHKEIKASMRQSKKRLIVFMDDIDRLQFKEVYEVLTIIRNVGDLPNTIFILAYDKEYLVKVLEATMKENSREYLSKFFQVEYELSKISSELIVEELIGEIQEKFPDLMKERDTAFIASDNISEFEDIKKVIQNIGGLQLIKNHREVVRFINALSITWALLKNEVLFTNFFQLELLRLKYGNVYSRIKNLDSRFISDTGSFYILNSNVQEELEKLVSDRDDRKYVMRLLKNVFPNLNEDNLEFTMAVNNKLRFPLYFKNDIIDNISINELTSLRNG